MARNPIGTNAVPSTPPTASTTMPSIQTAIVPTANPRTFSNFGKVSAAQFGKVFNKVTAKDFAKMQETAKQMAFSTERLNNKSAHAKATAERAVAYSEKKALDRVKAREAHQKLVARKASGETIDPKKLNAANVARKLASKDYKLAVQNDAKAQRQAVSAANKAEAARVAEQLHKDTMRLRNRVKASALQAGRSMGTAIGNHAAQTLQNTSRTMGRSFLRSSRVVSNSFLRAGSRQIARRITSPFGGGSALRNAGRRDGGLYANHFTAASRSIKTKLLTGVLPNRANMAGLIRGSMMNAGAEGAHAGNIFSRAFAGTMGLIKTSLTSTLVGVTMAAGAVLGLGINRALNIEDAKAKLAGLNYTGKEVQSIMSDVEKSVIGTKFSLDQAVTIGAGALAAGIKPGEELTQYLKTTADAATIAGVNMDQLGRIMNKLTANDKLMAQEGNQLADKGLPIWSWLAQNRGITVRELRKLVEQGKVSAKETRQVIEKNIGGVALKSAETTRGAFANMRIAYARFGAIVVGGALPIAKQFFLEHIKFADFMSQRFGPQITAFWDRVGPKATQSVANWGATIQKFLMGGYDNSITIIQIKAIIEALKNLGEQVLKLKPIQAVWNAIKDVFKNDDGSTKTFTKFAQDIIDGNVGIIDSMKKVYDWMMKTTANPDNFINKMWDQLVAIFDALKPSLEKLMPLLGTLAIQLANGLGSVLIEIMPALVKNLPKLGEALVDALKKAGPLVADLLPKLPGFITQIADGATKFMTEFVPFLEKFLPDLLKFLGEIGKVVGEILPPLIEFLTSNDGFWIKALLIGIVGYYASFVLLAGAIVIVATTIYNIILGITMMVADIVAFFKTGQVGNNLKVFIDSIFGTTFGENGKGGNEDYANSLGMTSKDNYERQVASAQAAVSEVNRTPYQVNNYNTLTQTVTNNSDVDAERMLMKSQEYFLNQPG